MNVQDLIEKLTTLVKEHPETGTPSRLPRVEQWGGKWLGRNTGVQCRSRKPLHDARLGASELVGWKSATHRATFVSWKGKSTFHWT